MLLPNTRGNFHFMKGNPSFSSAVIADPGYGIVHVLFAHPLPVSEGFDFMAQYLKKESRPPQAACAIELRSPGQFEPKAFGEFNIGTYRPALEKHDLLVDGSSSMTRSNVAMELNPPSQPVLYAFSYTMPAGESRTPRDFVLAGAADHDDVRGNIRDGETSDDAMREKAEYVMAELKGRLDAMGLTWDDCTTVNIYTAFNIFPFLRDVLLEPIGRAQADGLTWYLTRPPIVGLEFEADARRTLREIVLP
jgi:hypothetical protein